MGDGDDRWRRTFEAEQARMWRSLVAHTRDPEAAADAVAEAFAQGIRRGDEVRDPAAWAWRTAFRIADGLLASREPRDSGPADPPAPGVPEDAVDLLDALDRLPALDRRVVVLALVGGLGAAEIGALVDATPGAVRVRLHRARRQLRSALTDQPREEIS